MKLAEALILRADLKRKISQIAHRMEQNAKVQEGDEPAERIDELLPEYENMMDDLEKLIVRINKTNHETAFEGGNLAAALTHRDALRSRIDAYRELRDAAMIDQHRYSNQEIKFVRCVDVPGLQKSIDDLSKNYREWDTKIQGLNWTVELLD